MNGRLFTQLALLSFAVMAAGCGGQAVTPAGSDAAPQVSVVQVTAGHPQRKTIQRVTAQPGYIEALAETPLYAKLAGYVEKLNVDIGDRVTGPRYDSNDRLVSPGQVLVELSIPELDEDLQQKKALVIRSGRGSNRRRLR